MNSVSTPDRLRFIWAIWISYSKSVTARRPFTITLEPRTLAYSTSNPENGSTSTFPRSPVASLSIETRSSTLNNGCFAGFSNTATTTVSKCCPARSMMSR